MKFYDDKFKVPDPPKDGLRIMSVDVALMVSTKKKQNDASALYINDISPVRDSSYQSNFVYGETFEGLTTDILGTIIMRYFDFYKCDYLVLDCNGVGMGCFDFIIKDQYDSETGETYQAMTCVNDPDMASRCKVNGARKVIYSVKASADFNNNICLLLRNGILNGKIEFLIPEMDADTYLSSKYKQYNKLTLYEQQEVKIPYLQTTLAEYELIKLGYETVNNKIKVKEQSGMRKDRYSSIAYNYWLACQLELNLKPQNMDTQDLIDKLSSTMRRGTYNLL